MNLRGTLQQSREADLEKIQKIKKILFSINTNFYKAEPTIGILRKTSDKYDFQWERDPSWKEDQDPPRPITRREYIRLHPEIENTLDYSFSLSADDIIAQKIPMRVMGCTGIAKLFAKYAQDEDTKLDCFVVYTANIKDLERKKNGQGDIINGHQIIAVQFSDGVRLFDPGMTNGLQFYRDNNGQEIVVDIPGMLLGIELISQNSKDPWAQRQAGTVITSIEPSDRLEHIKSYKDLEKKYLINEFIRLRSGRQNG